MAISVPGGNIGAEGTMRHAPGAGELLDLIATGRPAWMADALCREHPEVDFFPELGQSLDPARVVCGACMVAEECLAYALANGQGPGHFSGGFGVWGGTAPAERRKMRPAARREEPAA